MNNFMSPEKQPREQPLSSSWVCKILPKWALILQNMEDQNISYINK